MTTVDTVVTHPVGWTTEPLKRSTYIKARVGWKGLTSDEFEESSHAYLVTGTDFEGRFIDWSKCYQVSQDRYEDDPYIQLRNGDLLITKDGTIGKLAQVKGLDKPACLNSGIFVLRPRAKYSAEFLFWVLSSEIFDRFVDLESYGSTINHLYQNVFSRFTFSFPRIHEQEAIASFLDRETAQIDAMIDAQQRLIDLLDERRLSLIERVSTCGRLDAHREVAVLGEVWLRELPAEWEFVPLGYHFDVTLGKMLDAGREDRAGDLVLPYLRAANLQDSGLDLSTINEMPYSAREARDLDLRRGDLLVVEGGAIGTTVLLAENMPGWSFQKTVNRVRSRGEASTAYLQYLLRILRDRGVFDMIANKSTIPHLTAEKLRAVRVPIPSAEEQVEIVRFLDDAVKQVESLRAQAVRSISLLRERRAAVITAAVTGRLDPRTGIERVEKIMEGAAL